MSENSLPAAGGSPAAAYAALEQQHRALKFRQSECQLHELPAHGTLLLLGYGEHGLHVLPDRRRKRFLHPELNGMCSEPAEKPRARCLADDEIPGGFVEAGHHLRHAKREQQVAPCRLHATSSSNVRKACSRRE
jgi:hypothetical protein